MLNPKKFNEILSDPQRVMDDLQRIKSERKLLNFIKYGWEALEPGQKFVTGYPVEAICDHLQAVTEGHLTRLLINVPPGCTKSMTTSVYWPAWEWGPRNLPFYRYIAAAHEKKLATRDNVRARDLILNEWYQAKWGNRFEFKSDQNAKEYYENSDTGWRMASSVGSGLTGYRGDRIILDDPHSVKGADSEAEREETLRWFTETLPTRLNKANESAIVVIMQRVHERDVSGLILAEELGYEHLMLPMEYEPARSCYSTVKPSFLKNPKLEKVHYNRETRAWQPDPIPEDLDPLSEKRYKIDWRTEENELLWPARFNFESVESLKKTMRSWGGTYAEAGQLQQRPAPRGGGMFKRDDFKVIDRAPKAGQTVRGWDLAASESKSAAYTAGVKMTLYDGDIYIEHVDRFKGSPNTVVERLKTNAKNDGKQVIIDIPQDPGQAGKAQKSFLAKQLHGYNVVFSPETGDKETRAMPLAAQVEAGNVYIIKGAWNTYFLNEAVLFPNGTFKDQIDAASRAYAKLNKTKKRKIGAAPQQA